MMDVKSGKIKFHLSREQLMNGTVAVVTDATSERVWFPAWHKYYSAAFGARSLFVVTYKGNGRLFKDFELGGIFELPIEYNDNIRAKTISSFVTTLLFSHDAVIRCDVDEFLIPDPRIYAGLADYVGRLDGSYSTAYGIEVFERKGEGLLDFGKSVLGTQRKSGIVNQSLHKTAITKKPLRWINGFHGASVPPKFDN